MKTKEELYQDYSIGIRQLLGLFVIIGFFTGVVGLFMLFWSNTDTASKVLGTGVLMMVVSTVIWKILKPMLKEIADEEFEKQNKR